MDNQHLCNFCGKLFSQLCSLFRHVRDVHENNRRYRCGKCGRPFHRPDGAAVHEKSCAGVPYQVGRGGSTKQPANGPTKRSSGALAKPNAHGTGPQTGGMVGTERPVAVSTPKRPRVSASSMPDADATPPNDPPASIPSSSGTRAATASSTPQRAPRQFRCRIAECNSVFSNRRELMRHRINEHSDPQHQRAEWTHPYPWIGENGDPLPLLRIILEDSRLYIFDNHRHGNLQSVFNFPLDHRNWGHELSNRLSIVRQSTREAIKLNLSLGMVLEHRETGEYRYFVPGGNVPLLPRPARIDTHADWDRFLADLQPDLLLERLVQDRPNTKWRLVLVTNLRVDVYYLGVNMGAGDVPDYIINNKCVLSLVKDRHGRPYEDSYCAFRALAYHRSDAGEREKRGPDLERETQRVRDEWGQDRLLLSDLPLFEEKFVVRVDVYSLDEDGAVYPRYLSEKRFAERMVLNLYNDHLSLVTNVRGYLVKYKCACCGRHFRQHSHWKRHRGHCARVTQIDFSHEHYRTRPTVFEELSEVGIIVDAERRVYPYFATFDCESLIRQRNEGTESLRWVGRHEAISVSVCSNITGYRKPLCFVNPDQSKLSTAVCGYLEKLSWSAYNQARQRWTEVFEALEADPTDECLGSEVRELLTSVAFRERQDELYKKFHAYCRQLPTLGFNSSNYDLNVLRATLFSALGFGGDNDTGYVIKKNNSYTAVANRNVRFLDISNYLAPGFSYAQFLRAYGVAESKSYFPYEWFDDASKLEHPHLPPYEAFWSTLKGLNVLDEAEGQEAGRRRYAELEAVWTNHDMRSFRDFLVYYNNLDTYPMVLAIEKMQEFYFSRDIDLFKVAVSVPGVARSMLYKTATAEGVSFSSVRPGDEDLYYVIKKNIVGGPSIIFTREHEACRTKIRGVDDIICSNILGYDANSLYLWALDQYIPTGDYVRRFKENDFNPICRGNKRDMFHWLDYIAQTEDLVIWHQRNHGEVKIGTYSVDGFIPGCKTVLEYDGCYYHGCEKCGLGMTTWREQKRRETEERRAWFLANKYEVRVMKEHDFVDQMKLDSSLKSFVDARIPPFYRHHSGTTTERAILDAVLDGPGTFFGFLEVDIYVPKQRHDYFSEMCPLFVNTDVEFDDIGEKMQSYAREHLFSERPRRLLVGGLRAKRVLLSSDLLRWYLKKGLEVEEIHQVIEYTPVRCFRSFVKEVTRTRREGDRDKAQKIIADTMKLIGNSAYGSVIMDKERHLNVRYYSDFWQGQLAINSPTFTKLSELSDDLYEISSAKTRLTLDLPVQIGFHILQLAKLRMLEFYYDFLDTYCDRSKFEMIEMDTDSNYLAVGGSYRNEYGDERPALELADIAFDRGLFLGMVNGSCNDGSYTPDEGWFLPRNCCQEHAVFDSRTPGLFKLEGEGDLMVGLCSKTYVLRKREAVKVISKGLCKGALTDPVQVYSDVLSSQVSASGINRGFRLRNDTMYTYQQVRYAIAYFYCKREVLGDGVRTRPLNITLCPWSKVEADIVVEGHPLWPDRCVDLTLSFGTFRSLAHVCAHVYGMEARDDLVKEALAKLAGYQPEGDLVFVAEGSFSTYDSRKMAVFWTSGVTARCARVMSSAKYVGLNHLALLYREVIENDEDE